MDEGIGEVRKVMVTISLKSGNNRGKAVGRAVVVVVLGGGVRGARGGICLRQVPLLWQCSTKSTWNGHTYHRSHTSTAQYTHCTPHNKVQLQ